MNDLAIFSSAPVYSQAILDHAKTFAVSAPQMPHISTKGSRFNFIRGSEVFVAPSLTIDVVVIAARKTTSRIWFAKEFDPNSAEKVKPSCWSVDGDTPQAPAASRPHVQGPAGPRPVTACAECPMNIKGSSRNGQGKACAFKQTLVVAPPTDLNEVWRLEVSGMGAFGNSQADKNLRSWKDYRDWLGAPRSNLPNGVAPNMVITRLSFDSRQSVPALQFGIVAENGVSPFLPQAAVEQAVARAKMQDVLTMLESDDEASGADDAPVAAPQPTALAAPSAPSPAQAPAGFAQAPVAAPVAAPAPVATQPVAPPAPIAPAPVAVAPAAPLRLAHPDVPEEVRQWAAHPAVTEEMVTAYLDENYPEALEVPVPPAPPAPMAPVAPVAPVAPAGPAAPPRKRRTKAEMEAARAAEAAATPAAPVAPVAPAAPSAFAQAPAAAPSDFAAAPVAAPAAPVATPAAAPTASAFAAPVAPIATPNGPGAPGTVGNQLADKLASLMGGFDDAGAA